MGVLLIFFCCLATRPDIATRTFFPIISRLGGFNSRLGRQKFPIGLPTGIPPQAIDLSCDFCGKTAVVGGKSTKFPVQREKPGFWSPPLERGLHSAS
jgi:hypothetical protein